MRPRTPWRNEQRRTGRNELSPLHSILSQLEDDGTQSITSRLSPHPLPEQICVANAARGSKTAMGPGSVKTFFLPQKLHATGRDPQTVAGTRELLRAECELAVVSDVHTVSTAKIRLPGYPGRRLPDGAVHGREGADGVTDRGGQPSSPARPHLCCSPPVGFRSGGFHRHRRASNPGWTNGCARVAHESHGADGPNWPHWPP